MTDPSYLPHKHPSIPAAKTGLLLVNLGTPDAPTAKAVRRYLREFLSDKRVVDYPRILWLPLLYGIILNVRPRKTAANYKKIWRVAEDESPLRYYTRTQVEKLVPYLDDIAVDWAMRYGTPSIEDRLGALKEQGCTRLVIFPLYPQYSATTTATVNDEVFRCLMRMNWQPAIRTVPAFHDDPAYISALAASMPQLAGNRDARNSEAGKDRHPPAQVILSFHGLPERYLTEGDPYHCHCHKTARLLRDKMGWTQEEAPLGFQSIFGREKWLDPKTEDLVIKAAETGKRHIAVATPGFVADCIETLEEIGIGLTEIFRDHGGERLTLVPCLNDTPDMISLLSMIARRELSGW